MSILIVDDEDTRCSECSLDADAIPKGTPFLRVIIGASDGNYEMDTCLRCLARVLGKVDLTIGDLVHVDDGKREGVPR